MNATKGVILIRDKVFKILILLVIFFLLLVLYIISYSIEKTSMVVTTVFLFFVFSWILSFLEFRKYFPLGVFSFMLFIFTFSSILVEWIDQRDLPYIYSPTTLESINLILISLVTFWMSYSIFNSFLMQRYSGPKDEISHYLITDGSLLEKSVFIILIFSGFLYTILNIEAVMFAFRYGYVAYYASFRTQLPVLFRKVANGFEMFFWIYVFMMKMPQKKRKVVFFIYILNLVLIFILGKRGPIILGVIMLVIYMFKTSMIDSQKLRLLRKRLLIAIIIAVVFSPVILTGLHIYSYIRVKAEISLESFLDGIKLFFITQGNSGLQHINYVVNFYDRINKYKSYLLSYVINEFRRSPVALLFGFYKEFIPQTYEATWKSGYWGQQFSYMVLGNSYFEGYGTGSCYIAEAYLDMKVTGVVIVNIIFALFINYVIYGAVKNPVIAGFLFYAIRDVLYAPRSAAFAFLGRLVNSYNLIALILILFLYYLQRPQTITKFRFSLRVSEKIK